MLQFLIFYTEVIILVDCSREDNIKLAEVVLKRIFNDPMALKSGIQIKTIYLIGKDYGLTRGVLKEARKRIGVLSENRNGVQYWYLPKEEVKPE